MSHNSFDIETNTEGYVAKSHNFPGIEGRGKTVTEAIENMDRKIIYFIDNDPKGFRKNVKERKEKQYECGCGLKLKQGDKIIGTIGV